ncbi:MAG TPA: zinc-binding dehydrogenase [Planctomycetota bacterium]|nr:zinc-binding dehydrogenase [Planctomycetota bacterium]
MTSTMLAAVLAAPRTVRVERVPLPTPGPGQVRVRLEGCGVCASNIPPWEGREWFSYPLAPGQLGHEGWGRVDAVGDGAAGLRVGDRVAFLSGHAYAEYDVCAAAEAVALPASLDRMPFPGEPLGCAMNIFQAAAIARGETVAIVGAGFLGQLLTRMAADTGARVIALSRRGSGLSSASRLGAAVAMPLDDHQRIIDEVRRLTGGRFCDVVIEATGKPWPLDLAGELCRERGRLVIAGYHQDGLRQINMQLWNWRGLTVLNAHWRDSADYVAGIRAAAAAVASGQLDPAPLFTHRYPLEGLGAALADTGERPDGFMKGLIEFAN